MRKSPRFRALIGRLRELRRRFLPANFVAPMVYSDEDIDRARAFRLLVHAEIESYLEDVAGDLLLSKMRAWKKQRAFSYTLFSLLASSTSTVSPSFGDGSHTEIDQMLDQVAAQFYHNKKNKNHGIKVENLKKLLVPIGIALSDLDATWLINIDEFGKRRGEISHSSVQTQQPLDPESELADLVSIVKGLVALDVMIGEL